MRRAFFYGWVVVAVTSIVVLVTAGIRAAPGAFLLSMTGEPGWSTASVSFAAAAGLIVFGLVGYVAFRRGRKASQAPLNDPWKMNITSPRAMNR